MNDTSAKEDIIDSASCPSCSLTRRPSMMKRLRRSFRRATSNRESLVAQRRLVSGGLRPSLSAEMLHSPEAFSEEPCDQRASHRLTFSATTLWDNLVSYLETNVNPGTRRRSLRMYNNCFFGHEAVNCLHKHITTNLSRQCDREQVAILCHRFLVLGIIEDAKCDAEADKDFNTSLLYRLTAQKKFWALACLKSEDEESDGSKEQSPVPLTCSADDCKKAAEEEMSNKCRKNIRQRSFRHSLLKSHLKMNKLTLHHKSTSATEEHSDHAPHSKVTTSDDSKSCSSTDSKSSTIDADSSGSSKGSEWQLGAQLVTAQQKAKKPAQTRKRRWHSIREKSHKAVGSKQAHLIPQFKTKISLKKKKQTVPSSEHWVAFGYI